MKGYLTGNVVDSEWGIDDQSNSVGSELVVLRVGVQADHALAPLVRPGLRHVVALLRVSRVQFHLVFVLENLLVIRWCLFIVLNCTKSNSDLFTSLPENLINHSVYTEKNLAIMCCYLQSKSFYFKELSFNVLHFETGGKMYKRMFPLPGC